MSLVGRLAGTLALGRVSQGHKQRSEGPTRIDPAGESVSSMSQALAHLGEELVIALHPEDSGGGWSFDSRNLGVATFFTGELIEIEAEPEQVERPGSSSPGKEDCKGIWALNRDGDDPVLEMKIGNQGVGMSVGGRGWPQLQEAPSTTIQHVLSEGRLSTVGMGVSGRDKVPELYTSFCIFLYITGCYMSHDLVENVGFGEKEGNSPV